jgi:hypothetical protein
VKLMPLRIHFRGPDDDEEDRDYDDDTAREQGNTEADTGDTAGSDYGVDRNDG